MEERKENCFFQVILTSFYTFLEIRGKVSKWKQNGNQRVLLDMFHIKIRIKHSVFPVILSLFLLFQRNNFLLLFKSSPFICVLDLILSYLPKNLVPSIHLSLHCIFSILFFNNQLLPFGLVAFKYALFFLKK